MATPSVKAEILKLGTACLCTPWPDGAMSSIISDLRDIARSCARDRDDNAATEAAACLRLCDALSMPRVPALSIVTTREHGTETQSAISLAQNLKSAREDIYTTETVVTKASRPLEDSPKKVEKKAKRQKVQPADEGRSTKVSLTAAPQDSTEPVASSATHGVEEAKPIQELMNPPKETLVTELAAESSKTDAGDANASEDPPKESIAGSDLSKQNSDDTDAVRVQISHDQKASAEEELLRRPPAAPKDDTGDNSDDDDFLPNIFVDGGPDKEDQ